MTQNIEQQKEEEYSTYDLGAATTLLTLGYEIWEMDMTNPRKVKFIFKNDPKVEKIVNQYLTDEVKVKARSYFDNLRALKNRMHTGKTNNY